MLRPRHGALIVRPLTDAVSLASTSLLIALNHLRNGYSTVPYRGVSSRGCSPLRFCGRAVSSALHRKVDAGFVSAYLVRWKAAVLLLVIASGKILRYVFLPF